MFRRYRYYRLSYYKTDPRNLSGREDKRRNYKTKYLKKDRNGCYSGVKTLRETASGSTKVRET